MTRIRMMETITGGRYDGRTWPCMGDAFHVPEWEAAELVTAKHAIYDDDPALIAPPAQPPQVPLVPGPGLRVVNEVREPEDSPEPPVTEGLPGQPGQLEPSVTEGQPGQPDDNGSSADGDDDSDGDDGSDAGTVAGDDGSDAGTVAGDAAGYDDPGPARPAVNHPKGAWVDYAVAQGADRATAEGKTKADLMSEFGSRL